MTSATRKSLELIVKCAASAASGLIWRRMRLLSVTKRIMPPRSANRSASLTVRIGRFLRRARMSSGAYPADRLKEDVALRDVVHSLIAMYEKRPRSATLPAHRGIEEVPERVAAQDPDDQRCLRVRNRLG